MPDQPGVQPDRIDVNSEEQLSLWATKLNVTAMQLRDAVGVAGDKASDVELHLRGRAARRMTIALRNWGLDPGRR